VTHDFIFLLAPESLNKTRLIQTYHLARGFQTLPSFKRNNPSEESILVMLNFTKILNTSSVVRKFWKAPDEFNTIFQLRKI